MEGVAVSKSRWQAERERERTALTKHDKEIKTN